MSNSHCFPAVAEVLIDRNIESTFDYGLDKQQIRLAKKGQLVQVTLKGKVCQGYILKIKETSSFSRLQQVHSISPYSPFLTHELFELAVWMSKYYATPLRFVLNTIFPASIRKNNQPKLQKKVYLNIAKHEAIDYCKNHRSQFQSQAKVLDVLLLSKQGIFLSELLEKSGTSISPIQTLVKKKILRIENVQLDRNPLLKAEFFKTSPKKLNDQQASALKQIKDKLKSNSFVSFLLYGITGSGKTEVYLQAIEQVLSQDKSVIILVPEISLTPQTIELFKARFQQNIAIIHHRLSKGELFDQWQQISIGSCSIVIGARSAVFTPVKNLGLIIVDEEHEKSYKQSDLTPRYHARDIAIYRSFLNKSCVVLGSATPSLESFYNAKNNKHILLTLDKRANPQATKPEVSIVDMSLEYEKKGYTIFSDTLLNEINKRLELGEQSLLFLNRRGYHSYMLCQECQQALQCPHCSISLSYHYQSNHLICHLCQYTLSPPPKICPICKQGEVLKFRGIGTEKIERCLHGIFPQIRIIRMDADTTKHKGSHEKLLRSFRTGKADLLLGTQMIAKGLDFPQVTLVGILDSDAGIHFPDFRSSENTFQIITQVAGRAGRAECPGKVILQTNLPQHPIIQMASKQDYLNFYVQEIESRNIFFYPPFSKMIKLLFTSKKEQLCLEFARDFYHQLKKHLEKKATILPVIPCGYAKIKGKFRFQILIRGKSIYTLNQVIERISAKLRHKEIQYSIDIDPSSTFF